MCLLVFRGRMRDKSWIHDGELRRGMSIVSLGQCESNGMMMFTFAKSAKSTTFYPLIQTIELISTSIDSTSTLRGHHWNTTNYNTQHGFQQRLFTYQAAHG